MEKDYLKTFENLPEIVIVEDAVGVIKYANEAFCRCHGVKMEDAIGKSCFDFIIPEDREQCRMDDKVTPGNCSYRIEGRSRRADGKIIWIQYVGKAFFSKEGKLLEFQELGVDITEWKEKIDEKTRELEKVNDRLNDLKVEGLPNKNHNHQADHFGNTAMYTFSDIITNNAKMMGQKIYAEAVAEGESSVLIEGESGTGKEMFAQAIHNSSKRVNGPFVAVNCGAVPSELMESEFFGYEEGAFTGAARGGKRGKFEMASGGTLFLDEIGEMPLAQQVALLRVLETRSIMRVGGRREIPVDIRIICATNKDLMKEAAEGVFRRDLYYRLNIINIKIPPLRDRREDIFLLTGYFIKRLGNRSFEKKIAFNDEQLIKLYRYDWPGNVRELRNIVERMKFIPQDAMNEIMPADIADQEKDEEPVRPADKMSEKMMIVKMMDECEGNVSMIARKMGMSRNTLYKKLRKYDIQKNR
ncbi:MAG: sigma 54-interacting transcriptional regulator [Eubacteriaceae bacterium]|nr:sigma 54-interacting transcriptional regulator [Eubacteriaceae bacterium]